MYTAYFAYYGVADNASGGVMNVGLVNVDSKMANIVLMKISTFYKFKKHRVNWFNPLFDSNNVDKIYCSKIFDFTPDYQYLPEDVEIIKGGSGYDIKSKLEPEIDKVTKLDYSIYPNCDYSMQFYSRGCVRNCPFCIVRQKEGYIYPTEPMSLNTKGTHIEVLDNNFFANPEWKWAINHLLKTKQPVNLHGVDAKIMTEEHAYYLNKLKHYKQIHIAWDNPRDNLFQTLKNITKWIKPYKLMCYVLIGYWSNQEEDLYRVKMLKELKISPFVMPFNKNDNYQRRFARWVNHKAVFNTVSWENYTG